MPCNRRSPLCLCRAPPFDGKRLLGSTWELTTDSCALLGACVPFRVITSSVLIVYLYSATPKSHATGIVGVRVVDVRDRTCLLFWKAKRRVTLCVLFFFVAARRPLEARLGRAVHVRRRRVCSERQRIPHRSRRRRCKFCCLAQTTGGVTSPTEIIAPDLCSVCVVTQLTAHVVGSGFAVRSVC